MNPKLKFHKTKIATAITLSSLIVQTPQIAVAQEQTLEEIIVTATRRDMVPSEIPWSQHLLITYYFEQHLPML